MPDLNDRLHADSIQSSGVQKSLVQLVKKDDPLAPLAPIFSFVFYCDAIAKTNSDILCFLQVKKFKKYKS